jgi:uncharacterized protein YkwD
MRRRFWVAWLVVCLFAPASLGQSSREHSSESLEPPQAGPKVNDQGPDLSRVAELILDRTNQFRTEQGREPLKTNDRLTKTAQDFANFLAHTDRFSHTADGNEPWEREAEHGYEYCLVLENIAWESDPAGFTAKELAERFVEGWKKSPGHRKNLLDPDVTEIGIGVAHSPHTDRYYAVQDFGRPKSEAIRFKVANRTDQTVRYDLDGKEQTLRPGYTMTYHRCRPPELRFRLGEGETAKAETFHPRTGSRYVVRQRDDGRLAVETE